MLLAKRLVLLIIATTLLVACAPRQRAEVVERKVLTQRQQDQRIGGQFIRIVQPGDTLYSIAFVTGLDVNKVAAWNGINDTSRLLAGQRIRLTEPPGFQYAKRVEPEPRVSENKVSAKSTQKKIKPRLASTTNTRSSTAKTKPSVVKRKPRPNEVKSTPIKPSTTKSSTAKSSTAKKARSKVKPSKATPLPTSVARWLWPLRGTLVKRFNLSQGQQGIDIQGQRGQIIKASAAGEVVYAGDSLKGYGNLIIIKHNSEYLSAYAHNQSITVKEGQIITQGQVIAKLGINLQGRSVAQFQIRKNGNPVDPMTFLR